jgi:N-ethylmaleimide reductase
LVEGEEAPDLYRYLVAELDKLGLTYLHLMHMSDEKLAWDIRARWSNPLLFLRTARALDTLGDDLKSGLADVLPIGRWVLANPDFIDRYRKRAPLNEADRATFSGGGAKGYTDYPRLAA